MADQIHSTKLQDSAERNVFVMLILLAVLLSVGGLVEIGPLFTISETMEHHKHKEVIWDRQGKALADWKAGDGVRPYTPLELAGREIYIREGCYTCHSQMIRPFRDEKERYGHYSLASESMYDHPFQWGSKRTGPDLARVGGKYSNNWHERHLRAPRSVVPESVMPNYPFLEKHAINPAHIQATMRTMNMMPGESNPNYTEDDIAVAAQSVKEGGVAGANELDAVVAYLQVLGTMVKFDDATDYRN